MSLDEALNAQNDFAQRVHDRAKRRRVDLGLAPTAVQQRPLSTVRAHATSRPKPTRPPAPETARDPRVPLNALQTRKLHAYGPGYDPTLESIHQDLARGYLEHGARPQNAIGLASLEERFEEHPKCVQLRDLTASASSRLLEPGSVHVLRAC